MKIFKINSYCKINLSLRVIKKLKNDYHEIESLITFGNIYDKIILTEILENEDLIKFEGPFRQGINKKNNTINKILNCLRNYGYLKNRYFKIVIKKNIPIKSGLGGGSMNAASLLKFFINNFKIKINNKHIYKICQEVGSDVILGLDKKNTFLKKVYKIKKTNKKINLYMLLVKPNINCSTKKIFSKNKFFSRPYKTLEIKKIDKLFRVENLKNDFNDLEKTVFKIYPKVKNLIFLLNSQKNCEFSRMSGSGSTCIAYFKTLKFADKARLYIKKVFPNYWCKVSKAM